MYILFSAPDRLNRGVLEEGDDKILTPRVDQGQRVVGLGWEHPEQHWSYFGSCFKGAVIQVSECFFIENRAHNLEVIKYICSL